MFFPVTPGSNGPELNLQATLSSMSVTHEVVAPHHPITCPGPLHMDEATFSCEHAKVPVDDERTRAAIIHTICILMFEIAGETL